MTGAQRYNDLDLQIDPTLIAFAIEYAKGYVGDWDVMIAARSRVIQEGSLPLSVARTVLNCARADPRVDQSTLPVGRSGTFTGAFPDVEGAEDTPEGAPMTPRPRKTSRRGHLRAVPEAPELYREIATGRRVPWRGRFELPVTWKRRYGMSGHKSARVWHVLDPDRSTLTYWPVQPNGIAAERDQYEARIQWICSGSYGPAVPRLYATPPDGLMCATCQRILDSDEYADVSGRAAIREWWQGELKRWEE